MANFELGNLVWRVTGETGDFERSVERSKTGLDRLGQRATRAGQTLTRNVTLPLAAVGTALIAATIETGKYADKLLDLEQITGLSTNTLQELEQVASDAGVSFDGLTGTVQRFSARLPGIVSGTTEGARAFEQLGVELHDASGNIRDMDELFPEMIQALQQVENVTERNAMAQQIFGRSLQDIAPVLGMTADEFDEARQKAHDLGLVLEKDALEAANDYRVSIADLGRQVQGLWRGLATDLIPVIQNDLIPILGSLIDTVRGVAGWFSDLDQSQQRLILGVGALAAGIGPVLLIGGKLIGIIGSLRTSFVALNAVMAANPALAVVAGLAALVAVAVPVIRSTGILQSANQRYENQLRDTIDAVRELSLEEQRRARAELIEEQIRLQEDLAEAVEKSREAEEAWNKAREAGAATSGTRGSAMGLAGVQERARLAAVEADRLKERLGILQQGIEDLDTAIAEGEALEQQRKEMQEAADAARDAAEAAEEQAKAAEEQAKAAQRLATQQETVEEIHDRLGDRINDLIGRHAVFGDEIDYIAEKTNIYRRAIEDLISQGLDPESDEIQELVGQYQMFADAQDVILRAQGEATRMREEAAELAREEARQAEEARRREERNAQVRADFARERMEENERALLEIEERRDALLAAGVDEIEVGRWADEEREKLHQAELARIDAEEEAVHAALEERQRVIQAELDEAQRQFDEERRFAERLTDLRVELWGTEEEQFANKLIRQVQRYEEAGLERNEIDQWVAEQYAEFERQQTEAARVELEERMALVREYASHVGEIFENLHQVQLNNIDARLQRQLESLDKSSMGEEAYQEKVEQLEKQAAIEKWQIEMQTFKMRRISTLAQIAMDTAGAIMKAYQQLGPVGGTVAATIIGILGATQAAVALSQPPPPRPSFALGGQFVTNGPQVIEVGDNPGGRERVTVEPLSSPGFQAGGQPMNIMVMLDGREVARTTAEYINDGQVRIEVGS